jgi:hypothetical protein
MRLEGIMSMDPQSRAELRVRLYSICSWCAELIDRQQGQQPRRGVRTEDLVAHVPQQHVLWLEMLGISEELCGDGFETVETGAADPFEI